jgi:hypothetical protein
MAVADEYQRGDRTEYLAAPVFDPIIKVHSRTLACAEIKFF